MDWKEKMAEAMKNLQDACNMNTEWAKCNECPFYTYCDSIEADWNITPSDDDFLDTV